MRRSLRRTFSRPECWFKPVALVWPLCWTTVLCWTKFNFHQTSSTTGFIYLLFLGAKETHSFRPVHTYPDIFDSAAFSFRIRLPSTRIRCIPHANPQLFESALQRGNFWIGYESRIVWTLKPGKFTVNIQDGAERNVIAFFGLQFQVL